jgi:enoyl-[acyl-carrier protein] reductase II
LISAGSINTEVLREYIQKRKKAISKPFAINVPLLYPNIEKILKINIDQGIKIIFISVRNQKTWRVYLK